MIFVINQILIMVESLLFSTSNWPKAKKIFGIITFFQLFLLLGLRASSVGTDTRNYLLYFGLLKNGIDASGFEILNIVLMRAIALLPNSNVVFLCIYAFLTIGLFYKYIYLESEDPYLSVAIFSGFMYYYFCFNAMRQSLAMAIVAVAITKLKKDKKNTFLFLVLIAGGFHTSALVAIPLWIVEKLSVKYGWKLYVLFISVSIGMAFLGRQIVAILLTLFPSYRRYIDSVYGEEGNYLNPLMYMAILTIITLIWERLPKRKEDDLWLIMLGVGTVLYFVSIQVSIVSRIVYYYTMALIVILPNILKRIPRVRNRLPFSVGAHVVVLIYSCLLVARGAHGIVPYGFFWQI